MKNKAYLGLDIGSISTKGVVIDVNHTILASEYIWTKANPIGAVKSLLPLIESKMDLDLYTIDSVGVTGSARKLIGAITSASVVKNEITAHAIGTMSLYPDAHTIFEIGGQDSKIILIENGFIIDYAMNTLCAAGTGAFLSTQANRLGVSVEEFGEIALTSKKPTRIAARCAVFAESDLIHKAQMGHKKEDIIAGLCQSVVNNYLNNVGKGKRITPQIVFQGGVSKNIGVIKAFEDIIGYKVTVDTNSHLLGALGVAILAKKSQIKKIFDFKMAKYDFITKCVECGKCSNNCEIICVYQDEKLIDSWGNKCEKGAIRI